MSTPKHNCMLAQAELMADWIQNRGGLAYWKCVEIGNPTEGWTIPAFTDAQCLTRTNKPSWRASAESILITDPSEVWVHGEKEVKRFHIAVRRATNGMGFKVTDGGTRRIKSELAKANKALPDGVTAWYTFDYTTQDAVIMAPVGGFTLKQYIDLQKTAEEVIGARLDTNQVQELLSVITPEQTDYRQAVLSVTNPKESSCL